MTGFFVLAFGPVIMVLAVAGIVEGIRAHLAFIREGRIMAASAELQARVDSYTTTTTQGN